MRMDNRTVRTEILRLLQGTGREGADRVADYLCRSDFFTARCHTHHRFCGGLARHSLETCAWALAHRGDIPAESVVISTLLHDTCTAYSEEAAGIRRHGSRSVKILTRICHLRLTAEEREAILLHMHGDAPQTHTNTLARLVNRADHESAGGHAPLGPASLGIAE